MTTIPAVLAQAIKPEFLAGPRKLFIGKGIQSEIVHEDDQYYLVNIPLWNLWLAESPNLAAMSQDLKPCGVARIIQL